ncbi:hypothetical protein [Bradyrhizobium guangdongense]|uniref:DUF1828 domain-containing protein n=1 Tax=Bradyrhizobium guangdongense TaxID=1325090 RepID=A0A410V708_9BRAD|nr:hypothetical protein [Bradyrhizobium guangdongense]QAU39448.1 hypothetical protein X265_18600 [Bradyrhizobium guangdongense]QOZ60508.1 hypothetical protein XH86_18610 [Bradyrhizobium guangdongense]GGI23801.1 hypothetical protein GCM10010987_26200 [Bradyrhizobium guangdongense]
MAERTEFVVEVNGRDRSLFSVAERPNGDLLIFFEHAERFGYDACGSEIRTQKYSVHVSPNSAEFSTLKQTLLLQDDTETTTSALTDAPKKGGFFVVFSRRPPDLASDRYLSNDDKHTKIRLGGSGVDANLALVYCVAIGGAKSSFGPKPNMGVIEYKFANFTLVVLSHYLTLPPHRNGDLLHVMTAPPQLGGSADEQTMLRNLMRGKDASGILDDFNSHSLLLANSLAHHLLKEIEDPALKKHLLTFIDNTVEQLGDAGTLVIIRSDSP